MLFEVREEGSIGEVLQAEGVVSHDIDVPEKVVHQEAVAVQALVPAHLATQVRRGS